MSWRRLEAGAPDLARLARGRLELDEAVAIEWELAASQMLVRRWTPDEGATVSKRAYP